MRKTFLLIMLFGLSALQSYTDEAFIEKVKTGTPGEVQEAIRAGAEVNARTVIGWTPLMWAAVFNQNPKVISLLIAAGAEVNARNKSGFTPLMFAAGNPNSEVISVLLAAGANINARNKSGFTPLIFAAAVNENPEVIIVLLDAGADGKAKCENKTAFDYAKYNEHLKGTETYWRLNEAQY